MTQAIYSHTFDNGLTLLAECMDWLESVAFSIQLPAGYIHDPPGRLGQANFASEMVQRGCGPRDSRQFVEDLDRLGVDRSAAVSAVHTSYGGAMLADKLSSALEIYADLVQSPHLPENQLEDGRQVCLQEILAMEDDLAHQTMVRLRHQHYGDPWGRTAQGEEAAIEDMTSRDIRDYVARCYQPRGATISVAGKIDWPRLLDEVGRRFGHWPAQEPHDVANQPPTRGYTHIPFESNQTQIGVAYANVPYRDPNYFQARGAVGILSDGMSSRLFTEVREKRGLCYTVYATCHSLRDRGAVLCYAGTSTERAQETLDVLLAELRRVAEGVEASELQRLKARIKSSLIMQQESSASRCLSMAADWYHLGRIVTMDEVSSIIDGLTCDSINAHLRAHPPGNFTVVTLGEKELEVPLGVS